MTSNDSTWQENEDGTWSAAIPEPFWTTKGLRWWKRFNEKNWLPQCLRCPDKPIFSNRNQFRNHWQKLHTDGKRYKRTPTGMIEL